jgi:hypothetical protein
LLSLRPPGFALGCVEEPSGIKPIADEPAHRLAGARSTGSPAARDSQRIPEANVGSDVVGYSRFCLDHTENLTRVALDAIRSLETRRFQEQILVPFLFGHQPLTDTLQLERTLCENNLLEKNSYDDGEYRDPGNDYNRHHPARFSSHHQVA